MGPFLGCYCSSCYGWGLFLAATIGLGYNLMIVKFYSIKLNQPHTTESWERERGGVQFNGEQVSGEHLEDWGSFSCNN